MSAVLSDENYLNQSALLETGDMKPFTSLTIQDKEDTVSTFINYHCLIKPKVAMDQFLERTNLNIDNQFSLQVLVCTDHSAISAHVELLKELFNIRYLGDDRR